MSSSNNGGNNSTAGRGTTATPPRPHWRTRDPTATVVYVVPPSQFRSVVQQLTGAASPNTATSDAQRYVVAPCVVHANAGHAAVWSRAEGGGGEGASRGTGGDRTTTTTMRQMLEECMAWASDDHDEN
ncbi:unnamed protein product [Triticum turgidum subsp. durum]|uniref:VQ domain-containing protein n=1 Tax=Triticum turgidum subsp. durum TaxID=4567 RepID=A0A9R1QXH4_TRITD|nr:unnamed protein product [Triticum turgidum subsp. durum]